MANQSESVAQDRMATSDGDQLELPDRLFRSCCIKLPMRPRGIGDKHWRRRKSLRANFVLRKIGLRN